MISFKKTIDIMEESEQRFLNSVQSYLALVASLEEYPVPVSQDLILRFREHLKETRRHLGLHPSIEELRRTHIELDREIRDYRNECETILKRRENDVKQILETVADALGALSTRNEDQHSRLGEFTKRLEIVSRLNSITEVRRRLTEHVEELKTWMSATEEQQDVSMSQLHRDLRSFQRRLMQAERLAYRDALTGAANRAEGARRLDSWIESGERFSILLFDLDDFKQVNDTYGHQTGDVVLQRFAQFLIEGLRPEDTVCRWGGDEFLVILGGCNLENAMARAKLLADSSCGDYSIDNEQRQISVAVSATVGAAEYRSGETCEEVFARADKFLYREKKVPTLT